MVTSYEIANAYIALTVKAPGIRNDIARELGSSSVTSEVAKQGQSIGGVMLGAVAGAAAAATSKAISLISGSIGAAVSRVDTMSNFPKIMANLGYSAEDASASIDTMSSKLMGLPTSLNAMTGVVQQLAPLTGGLDEATELSLALNNALLAGGKPTEIQANAMEQYVQQLAVGKVDMTAWRSMVAAMPGQLNQLAQELVGVGANSMDLYAAMQDGTVSFEQFNGAILKLNDEGTAGFASFSAQAKDATGGISTGWENLQTAVTRNLANIIEKLKPVIDAVIRAGTDIANALGPVVVAIADFALNSEAAIPILAGLGAVLLAALAPAIWSAVQATWAFTGALLANPVTWIVLAIGALVAAIVALAMNWDAVTTAVGSAFSWLWETIIRPVVDWIVDAWNLLGSVAAWVYESILKPAFEGIAAVATWLYETILKPVFDGIGAVVGFVAGAIGLAVDLVVNYFRFWGAIAVWLWQNAVQPVFQAIGDVFTWIWSTVIQPVINWITGALNFLGLVVQVLWATYVQPVFNAIGAVFTWIWGTIIQPVITWITDALNFLGLAFRIAYEQFIKPAFDGIGQALSSTWSWIDQYVFKPFRDGIDLIVRGFQIGADAIGKAWDGIKQAAAMPINFVLDTVWNKGLRSFWNDLVGNLGLSDMKLPPAPLVRFASGGVMPGYTPGRDVHQFYSPTGGFLALSGGEAIMRPEFTRAVGGPAGVDRLNAMARNGQAFAGGGVFDAIGSFAGDVWENIQNAASVAWEFLSNPGAAIQKHVVDGIIRPLMADQNIFGQTVGGLAIKTVKDMAGMFANAAPAAETGKGMGWEAMWNVVKNAVPGAVMTSNFRPGAKTVNGYTSMHSLGRAIDLIPASMSTFNQVKRLFPNATELIYTPAGMGQLYQGKPFNGWSDAVKRQHYNHVHLAMNQGGVVPKLYDQGGWLPHGGVAVNRSGRPEAVLSPAESSALRDGRFGMPSELVVVDVNGELIGRMRVEASGVVAAAAHADDIAWRSGRKSL